ncbi:MAG: hypothetical protein N2316_08180, partial [Spirochaetes bacterium]|nr:hypothetical protein [Spirochaetota bacterium]
MNIIGNHSIKWRAARHSRRRDRIRLQMFPFLFILPIVLHHIDAGAQHFENTSQFHIGFFSGYSTVHGHYEDELNSGPYISIFSIPPIVNGIDGFFNFSFASHELSASKGSYVYSLAFNAGPLFQYRVGHPLGIFAAPFARIEYLHLKANRINREENTAKVGLGGIVGSYLNIRPAFRII